MCAVAARLARVVKCCVTSPAADDDVTTRLNSRDVMVQKVPDVAVDVDAVNWLTPPPGSNWTGCLKYSVDEDNGNGNFSGPELVCCCERCDSLSAWLLIHGDSSPQSAGGGGEPGVTPFRVRNCLLAYEVDRLRHRRTTASTTVDSDEKMCEMADNSKLSCSLLGTKHTSKSKEFTVSCGVEKKEFI